MSAYLVSVETIDAIISAWIEFGDPRTGWRPSDGPNRADRLARANEIGRILWGANRDNLVHLYPRDHGVDSAIVDGYTFTPCPISPHHARALAGPIAKVLASYEYQCVDVDTWEKSAACRFVDGFRRELLSRLPGYDRAPWGTSDRTVWSKVP